MIPRPLRAMTRARGPFAALLLLGVFACGDPPRHTVGKLRGSARSIQPRRRGRPRGRGRREPTRRGTAHRRYGEQYDRVPVRRRARQLGCRRAAATFERWNQRVDLLSQHAPRSAQTARPLPDGRHQHHAAAERGLDHAHDGLIGYVSDERAAGTGVGIDFFGVLPPVTMLDCSPDLYETPTVPVRCCRGTAQPSRIGAARDPAAGLAAAAGARRGAGLRKVARGLLCGRGATGGRAHHRRLRRPELRYRCARGLRTRPPSRCAARRPCPPMSSRWTCRASATSSTRWCASNRSKRSRAKAAPAWCAASTSRISRAQSSTTLLAVQQAAEPCDYFIPEQAKAVGSVLSLAMSADAVTAEPAPLLLLGSDGRLRRRLLHERRQAQITLCPVTCDSMKRRGQTLAWTIDCPMP